MDFKFILVVASLAGHSIIGFIDAKSCEDARLAIVMLRVAGYKIDVSACLVAADVLDRLPEPETDANGSPR